MQDDGPAAAADLLLRGNHGGEDELRSLFRRGDIIRPPQNCPGLGEGVDHQAVPFGQDFFVAAGMDAALARLEQDAAAAGDDPGKLFFGDLELLGGILQVILRVEDVGAVAAFVEIAARGDVEVGAEERAVVGTQQRQHLVRCPDEELTLDPLAVRVLGAVETALG